MINCVCKPIESENSPSTETEDAVIPCHLPPHDNLDEDVVDEYAQLSASPLTIHHVHMYDPSPPPEHTLAASTQTTGTPDPCNRLGSLGKDLLQSQWQAGQVI